LGDIWAKLRRNLWKS